MKRTVALIVACCACGQVEQSNNGLSGKWLSTGGIDCVLTLELFPGPDGVEGSVSGSVDCSAEKWSVSTLPDHQTMRWTSADGVTQDFAVRIRPACGLPLSKTPADLVRVIDLQPLVPAPGTSSGTFVRDAPDPVCSAIFPPSG
ncbi:MAG TPA: hypothetical protein VGH20_11495 [Myxococcales bacterium]